MPSTTNADSQSRWFDRILYPPGQILSFVIIALLSCLLSFVLIGRQIYLANWGLIDDHSVFYVLGPALHLSPGEIWPTLLSKTNEGQVFRPTYYLVRLMEASLWGTNVHLWYAVNTVCFAVFLSSIWWTLFRFVGGWLGGALTAWIALLPLWTDVWSRLGPSEIYGAGCIGIMIFAANFLLHSSTSLKRNLSAIALTLAAIVLAGLKEPFIPLAAGAVFILIFAGTKRLLSPILIGILSVTILACAGTVLFFVVKATLATGTDYYGKSVGPFRTVAFAAAGLVVAFVQTSWIIVLPIVFLQILRVVPVKSFKEWVFDSRDAVFLYIFLIALYATQSGLYRTIFPTGTRYDFPAALLVPFTFFIIACEGSRQLRRIYSERTIIYAQFIMSVFVLFALAEAQIAKPFPLQAAVKKNIVATNLFYTEFTRLVQSAKEAPAKPIILEAHGPFSYEGTFSLSIYMTSLGITNPVSVRYHSDAAAYGNYLDQLQAQLLSLQASGDERFKPFAESLTKNASGCLSVGIYGAPDKTCTPFTIRNTE